MKKYWNKYGNNLQFDDLLFIWKIAYKNAYLNKSKKNLVPSVFIDHDNIWNMQRKREK